MEADEKFFQTEFQEKAYPWKGPFWPALTIYHISPLLCFIMHRLIGNTSQQIPETANLQCSRHARYTQSISVVVRIMLRRFWGLGEMLDILLNCNKKNLECRKLIVIDSFFLQIFLHSVSQEPHRLWALPFAILIMPYCYCLQWRK